MIIKPYPDNKGKIVWDNNLNCELVYVPSAGRYTHAICAEKHGHELVEEADQTIAARIVPDANKYCYICKARFAAQVLDARPSAIEASIHFL